MAGQTPYLKLGYFQYNDRLDYDINIQRQMDRFLVIDKQMFGLYSILGNGVISGWDLSFYGFSATTGIALSVSFGMGIIKNIACQTNSTSFINGLLPNAIVNIFATLTGTSPSDRKVLFQYSVSQSLNNSSILLAKVTTGASSIISIDTSVSQVISYQKSISQAIGNHKHRGLVGQPSKISLQNEVKGYLSGSNIDNIDSSKIQQGRFNKELAPNLVHNQLIGSGQISHAQLDTFYQTLSGNQQLFGIIPAINHLQQSIFLKTKYVDIDKYFNNEIIIIPGYSDSLIDFNNSTALIDTVQNIIIGLPLYGQKSYFYSKNFSFTSPVKRAILTCNGNFPVGSSVLFGASDSNSLDFATYSPITVNQVTQLSMIGNQFRIGIQFFIDQNVDPYDPQTSNFNQFIQFQFQNTSLSDIRFHFRCRFYEDPGLSILFHTSFSENDQQGWFVNETNSIPSDGWSIAPSQTIRVRFIPTAIDFNPGQPYYLSIDMWDGDAFQSQMTGFTFKTFKGSQDIIAGLYPQIKNFAILFQLQSKQKIQVNI